MKRLQSADRFESRRSSSDQPALHLTFTKVPTYSLFGAKAAVGLISSSPARSQPMLCAAPTATDTSVERRTASTRPYSQNVAKSYRLTLRSYFQCRRPQTGDLIKVEGL